MGWGNWGRERGLGLTLACKGQGARPLSQKQDLVLGFGAHQPELEGVGSAPGLQEKSAAAKAEVCP